LVLYEYQEKIAHDYVIIFVILLNYNKDVVLLDYHGIRALPSDLN